MNFMNEEVKILTNEKRTKIGLEILQAAILLGILGDVLLRETPWGLNALLFVGALVAAMAMLILRRKNEFWTKHTIALNCALIFFAACFAWRDSAELQVFDALAILTIFAVLTLPALKIKVQTADVFHYVLGFVWSGMSAACAPFLLLFDDIGWKTIPQTGWSKHLISGLRGLLIAVPILLVFGWFALTVLRGSREKFAWGALWSAMLILGILHAVNPDAYIVRANVNLMREGRSFDAAYNASLSDDAAPALLDALPSMNLAQKCLVQRKLSHRFNDAREENDFRSWNWSRRTARRAAAENIANFDNSNCPNETNYTDYNDSENLR